MPGSSFCFHHLILKFAVYSACMHAACTLGRFDIVMIFEAPSEKEALAWLRKFNDTAATETLVATEYVPEKKQ